MTQRPSLFDRLNQPIETELKRVVGNRKSPLYQMLRYHFGWIDQTGMPERHGGQERRLGTLCLAIAESASAATERALPAAAAVELTQAFYTIHSELKEGKPDGAGRPALWWVWGHSQGINAGDGMYALARLAVMDLESRGISAEVTASAAKLLDRACLELCEVQYRGIEAEAQETASPRQHLALIEGPIGSLYACAAQLAGLVAGVEGQHLDQLASYGRSIGVAGRLRADIDTFWGGRGDMAASLVDALDKRRSLPLLYALASSDAKVRDAFGAATRRENALTDDEARRLLTILEESGARLQAEKSLSHYASKASEALKQSGLPPSRLGDLREYAVYLSGVA
ncbi:MAG: polyprenyl synthetase family protein [Chloroflexi bacterium]|nr:polyprenyl synthetase family protein [Chloroflexota bacterium]